MYPVCTYGYSTTRCPTRCDLCRAPQAQAMHGQGNRSSLIPLLWGSPLIVPYRVPGLGLQEREANHSGFTINSTQLMMLRRGVTKITSQMRRRRTSSIRKLPSVFFLSQQRSSTLGNSIFIQKQMQLLKDRYAKLHTDLCKYV